MRLDNTFYIGQFAIRGLFALRWIRYAFIYKLFLSKIPAVIDGGFFCFTVKDIFYASELNFLGEKNADFFSRVLWQFRYGKV